MPFKRAPRAPRGAMLPVASLGCRPLVEATVLSILFACTAWAVMLALRAPAQPADDDTPSAVAARQPPLMDRLLLSALFLVTLVSWGVAIRRILGRWCLLLLGGDHREEPPPGKLSPPLGSRGRPAAGRGALRESSMARGKARAVGGGGGANNPADAAARLLGSEPAGHGAPAAVAALAAVGAAAVGAPAPPDTTGSDGDVSDLA